MDSKTDFFNPTGCEQNRSDYYYYSPGRIDSIVNLKDSSCTGSYLFSGSEKYYYLLSGNPSKDSLISFDGNRKSKEASVNFADTTLNHTSNIIYHTTNGSLQPRYRYQYFGNRWHDTTKTAEVWKAGAWATNQQEDFSFLNDTLLTSSSKTSFDIPSGDTSWMDITDYTYDSNYNAINISNSLYDPYNPWLGIYSENTIFFDTSIAQQSIQKPTSGQFPLFYTAPGRGPYHLARNKIDSVISPDHGSGIPPTQFYKARYYYSAVGIGLVPSKLPKASFYPNPSSGLLKVELEAGHNYKLLQIYNLQGRLLHVYSLESQMKELDIRLTHQGFYLLRLMGEKYSSSEKILVN